MSRGTRQSGFTVVELMVALLLGLLLTGAVISAFLANRRVYAATESLGRVQENGRAVFEVLSRDAREAGGNPCNSTITPVNVVNNFALPANRYADLATGITETSGQLVFRSGTEGSVAVDVSRSAVGYIGLANAIPGLASGNIVVACDPTYAAVFQATLDAPGANRVRVLAAGTPGNSTTCLASDPTSCGTGTTQRYVFGCQLGDGTISGSAVSGCPRGLAPASVGLVKSVTWYVGDNKRGGSSLYRRVDGPVTGIGDEIADGVTSMQLTYLYGAGTKYEDATKVSADNAWPTVRAMRVVLTFQGQDAAATAGLGTLERVVAYTIALRNRING